MRYTNFSEKYNCLYINSNQLLPDTSGMTFKESYKARKEAFKKTYEERLKLYANNECRKEVEEELKKHKGCEISEFLTI